MTKAYPGREGGNTGMSVLELQDVTKTYGADASQVHALRGVSLSVQAG